MGLVDSKAYLGAAAGLGLGSAGGGLGTAGGGLGLGAAVGLGLGAAGLGLVTLPPKRVEGSSTQLPAPIALMLAVGPL
ncbi:hypothetical protein COO60DRAFT_1636667 [Scenedesmus sp. NREL 46B-D3]|nr:hypothetical protein COO60DRAFT_1636667 [Scenedesmus sp. NREL 46B-D3]